MIKFVPITMTVLAGGADSLIRRNDVEKGRANPDGSAVDGEFAYAAVWEALLAFGGIGADMMRALSPDITEPLIYAGTTMLGQRGGNFVSTQVISPTPMLASAQPYYGGGNNARAAAALGKQEERQFVLG